MSTVNKHSIEKRKIYAHAIGNWKEREKGLLYPFWNELRMRKKNKEIKERVEQIPVSSVDWALPITISFPISACVRETKHVWSRVFSCFTHVFALSMIESRPLANLLSLSRHVSTAVVHSCSCARMSSSIPKGAQIFGTLSGNSAWERGTTSSKTWAVPYF